MAVLNNYNITQGTLAMGSNVLITYPRGYQGNVELVFTNSVAYDIGVSITRVSNGTTVQLYSLSLDPDDTVKVSDLFLFPGDSIDITTSVANTNYQMVYTFIPFVKIT